MLHNSPTWIPVEKSNSIHAVASKTLAGRRMTLSEDQPNTDLEECVALRLAFIISLKRIESAAVVFWIVIMVINGVKSIFERNSYEVE